MAIHVPETVDLAGTVSQPQPLDAQILREAIWKSVYTSSESFLKTIEDVDKCGTDYWEREIDSATWAVIQQGKDVVGVAVARWPDPVKDRHIDRVSTRFIESVWIDPELRGSQLGEQLVRFLFAAEYAKSPGVRTFLLWVFEQNKPAIRLYERMKFECIDSQYVPDGSGRLELLYSLEPHVAEMAAAAEGRQQDLGGHGVVTYRVLGDRETS